MIIQRKLFSLPHKTLKEKLKNISLGSLAFSALIGLPLSTIIGWKGGLITGAAIGAGLTSYWNSDHYIDNKNREEHNEKDQIVSQNLKKLEDFNNKQKISLPVSSYKDFYKKHPEIYNKLKNRNRFEDYCLPDLISLSRDEGLNIKRYLPLTCTYDSVFWLLYDLKDNKVVSGVNEGGMSEDELNRSETIDNWFREYVD